MAPFSDGFVYDSTRRARAPFGALDAAIASSSATMYIADDLDPLFRTTTAAVNGETVSGASNMRQVLP